MNVLREIEKGVQKAERLLKEDVQNAKRYKESYRNDVELLIQSNEVFLENSTKEFEAWSKAKDEVIKIPEGNAIRWLTRSVLMKITNHYLDKSRFEMEKAGELRDRLQAIKDRFEGFLLLT